MKADIGMLEFLSVNIKKYLQALNMNIKKQCLKMIAEMHRIIEKVINGQIDIPALLVFISLIFIFFYRFIIGVGAKESIKYILDVITIVLALISIKKKQMTDLFKITILIYGLIVVIGTITRLFNIDNWTSHIVNYLMDIRMLARYPLYAFSCISVLDDDDCKIIKKLICAFNVINAICIVYQYFTVDVWDYWMRGDYINGFFGAYRGGNLYENVLLVIVTIIVLDGYAKKKIKASTMLINIILNLFIATIIELKFFYLEVAVIFLTYFLASFKESTNKDMIRIIKILVTLAIVGFCFINILYKLYPWMRGTLSSWERMSDYLSNSHGDSQKMINRTTFISDVYHILFHGNITDLIFGIGLGSANTGNVGGVLPEFTQKYINTAYSWYSSSYLLVETGIIGFILYFIAFIMPVRKKYISYSSNRKMIICTCIMSIMMIFYNETFRTEAGLMMCILFAIANNSDPDIKES